MITGSSSGGSEAIDLVTDHQFFIVTLDHPGGYQVPIRGMILQVESVHIPLLVGGLEHVFLVNL